MSGHVINPDKAPTMGNHQVAVNVKSESNPIANHSSANHDEIIQPRDAPDSISNKSDAAVRASRQDRVLQQKLPAVAQTDSTDYPDEPSWRCAGSRLQGRNSLAIDYFQRKNNYQYSEHNPLKPLDVRGVVPPRWTAFPCGQMYCRPMKLDPAKLESAPEVELMFRRFWMHSNHAQVAGTWFFLALLWVIDLLFFKVGILDGGERNEIINVIEMCQVPMFLLIGGFYLFWHEKILELCFKSVLSSVVYELVLCGTTLVCVLVPLSWSWWVQVAGSVC